MFPNAGRRRHKMKSRAQARIENLKQSCSLIQNFDCLLLYFLKSKKKGSSLLVRLPHMLTRRRTSPLWLERRIGSVCNVWWVYRAWILP